MRLGSKRAIDDLMFSLAKPGECPENACAEEQFKTQLAANATLPDCPCECPDGSNNCQPNEGFIDAECRCEGCDPDVNCEAPKTFKVKNNEQCQCECPPDSVKTDEQCVQELKAEGSTFDQDNCRCNCPDGTPPNFIDKDAPKDSTGDGTLEEQKASEPCIGKTATDAGSGTQSLLSVPRKISFDDPEEELAYRAMHGLSPTDAIEEVESQNVFVRCYWWYGYSCPAGWSCFRSMISCQLYFNILPEESSSSSSCSGDRKRVLIDGESHYVCCEEGSPGLSYTITTSDEPLECEGTTVATDSLQYCFECLPVPRPPSPGGSSSSSSSNQYYCVVDKMVSPTSSTSMYDFFNCVTTSECQSMFGPGWYALGIPGSPPSCFCVGLATSGGATLMSQEVDGGNVGNLAFQPGQQPYCVSSSELDQSKHEILSGPYSADQCNENCGVEMQPVSSSSSGSSSSGSQQPQQPSSSSQAQPSSSSESSSSSSESSSTSSFVCPDVKVPTGCRCGIAAEVTPEGCVELYCDECEDGEPAGDSSSQSSQPPGCPYPSIPQCGCDTYGVDTDENGCIILVCRCPSSSTSGGDGDGGDGGGDGDGGDGGDQPSSSSGGDQPSSSSGGDQPSSSSGGDQPSSSSSVDQPSSSSGGTSGGDGGDGGDQPSSSSSAQPSSSSSAQPSSSSSGQPSSSSGDGGDPEPSSSSVGYDQSSSSSLDYVKCPTCGGEGSVDNSSSSSTCPTCEGTGRVPNIPNFSSSSSAYLQIVQNPTDKTVVVRRGYPELFMVSVVSSSPVVYKWQHSVDGGANYFDINPNGGVFSGSDSPTLGVNPGVTDLSSVWNGAKFRCVVESGGSTIVSEPGTLTVVECEQCEAMGEVTDEECVCVCECPDGETNTGVAFAPNGELVCECLLPGLWISVSEGIESSSGDQGLGLLSDSVPLCISADGFDESVHILLSQSLFVSEGDCLASESSSSSEADLDASSSSN
jgi:hypothetical protein